MTFCSDEGGGSRPYARGEVVEVRRAGDEVAQRGDAGGGRLGEDQAGKGAVEHGKGGRVLTARASAAPRGAGLFAPIKKKERGQGNKRARVGDRFA
jgi:hypothetical protein